LADLRDGALLLIGFAGSRRSSDLVVLDRYSWPLPDSTVGSFDGMGHHGFRYAFTAFNSSSWRLF
jgi:hypothetical protein